MKNANENCITAAQVKALAQNIGISDTGICSGEDDTALLSHLTDGLTPFVGKAQSRISAKSVLPGAQSVIVCAFCYANPPQENANISRYAWGKDYHIVVKDYLSRLLGEIQKLAPHAEGYIFSDDSPLCDKALAYRAGLGYFGKNSLLLHPKFGSLFFIGGIVTNLCLDTDSPVQGSCGNCTACTDACPAQLCGNGQLEGYNCISYLQQKKGALTQAQEALLVQSGSAWGCDLCINACPKNRASQQTEIPEFAAIDPYLPPDLTEADFTEKYKDRAFYWRGYKTIKRNLDILSEKR